MAAAATFTTPQLVEKPGAQSATWNYFGFGTNRPKHYCANGVTKHVWPRVETLPTWQNT